METNFQSESSWNVQIGQQIPLYPSFKCFCRANLLTHFCPMDGCPKLAECGHGEVIDSSESQFRFVLPRILQNATFQQKPFEIDNRWTEIQNLMFIHKLTDFQATNKGF